MNGTKEYEKKFGAAPSQKTGTASSNNNKEVCFHSLDSSVLVEQFRGLTEKMKTIGVFLADY